MEKVTYIHGDLFSNQKQIGASKPTKFGINKIQDSSDVNGGSWTEFFVGQQLVDWLVSSLNLERITKLGKIKTTKNLKKIKTSR